jgi:hypothetical protein
MITLEEIDDLCERSKDDRALIVGSEIRVLCAAARRGVESEHELQNAFEDAVTRAERAEAELAAAVAREAR